MSRFRRFAAVPMAVLMAAAAPVSPALACAFDGGPSVGLFDSNFVARYPQSSVVYFAIADAVDQGVLERAVFEQIGAGPSGYWSAVKRLEEFERRLSAMDLSTGISAISLVFIESDLWARFARRPGGFDVTPHTSGPRSGDAVIETSEGALTEVLEGRLSIKVALDRGLIAVDGDEATRAALRALLAVALDPAAPRSAPAASAQREPARAPARLFGPMR